MNLQVENMKFEMLNLHIQLHSTDRAPTPKSVAVVTGRRSGKSKEAEKY